MAYVNVKEWSPDQVTEWLRGLDNVIPPYINSFLNNEVKGHQLLNLRSDDLEHLGVYTLGHQELILEAVEHLRNFHYELDRENLQLLALRLSCASHSLYNELVSVTDTSKVETQTMSDVANIISNIKPLYCWLDRSPFSGQVEYTDRKEKLLQLSLEMATCAQRDRFAEQPVAEIRTICHDLAELADNIIQEICDPMLLQPASLDLATLKKKENELGFSLMPSFHGIHQIADIKFASPAHTSNKLEEGDEIVQVNYQTVVGWQRKKVLLLFQESPPDIVLTVKKRPRHTKVYGQIYMKPYRLPSKKRATSYSRWNDNLQSPRPELLTIPDIEMPLPRLPPIKLAEPVLESGDSSSDSEPLESPREGRVYPLKPRPVLQRRNTITGASPTSKRPDQNIEQYWNEFKHQAAFKHSSSTYIESDNSSYKRDSVYLRDKSASCGHGLELSQRPVTYPKQFDKKFNTTDKKQINFSDKKIIFDEKINEIVPVTIKPEETKRELSCIKEISTTKDIEISTILKDSNFVSSSCNINTEAEQNLEKSISVGSLILDEPIKFIDETTDEISDRSNMNPEWKNEIIEEIIVSLKKSGTNPNNSSENNNSSSTSPDKNIDKTLEMTSIIPKKDTKPTVLPRTELKTFKKPPEVPAKPEILRKPAVPPRNFTKVRGKLDKSHSTPAYDLEEKEKTPLLEIKTPIQEVKTPEILITEVSDTDLSSECKYNEIDHPYTQIEYHDLPQESSPVVETINSALEIKENDELRLYKSSENVAKVEQRPEPPPRTIYMEKKFDPKVVSTPISKTSGVEFPEMKSEIKISPTNSVVRAMIYPNKNKSKKKSAVLAKRRKVSVKDLNPCEIQGFLYQRLRNKHTQSSNWEKRWFVLTGNCLYGFKNKDANKAECLIFLSGFTVATASEVRSRSHAFRVYHTGTAFYFSAENSETMSSWIELITNATHISDNSKSDVLFSESDDSDTEKSKSDSKEKLETSKLSSLKKFATKKNSNENISQNGSTSLDRKYLRFFNNSSKKNLPVPTPQFRSYRKVVPPNLVVNQNTPIPKIVIKTENAPKPETLTLDDSKNKLKPKPINYMHASNPSLCDINDYRIQNFYHKRQFSQRSENLAGFVTLEEFMLKRQEEDQQHIFSEPINPNSIQPDVVYGEVSYAQNDCRYKNKKKHYRNNSDVQETDKKDDVFKTVQSRTLPKLRNEEKLVSDAKISEPYELLYADKKSLKPSETQKNFRDRSYELIYCPKKVNDVQFAQNRTLDGQKRHEKKTKLARQHSLNSADKKDKIFNRGESPEKFWLDSLRRSDKVTDKNGGKVRLKSATQYTPMCLPLTPDPKGKMSPKFAFELNLDEKNSKSSFFGKSFFGSKTEEKKEKTLLGSPRLHRALFRKHNTPDVDWTSETPQVVPVTSSVFGESPVVGASGYVHSAADYPGLEYPPVFHPETYSLANPACNLSLRPKHNH